MFDASMASFEELLDEGRDFFAVFGETGFDSVADDLFGLSDDELAEIALLDE